MTSDLDITALAAQIEERCSTLEREIAALRAKKTAIGNELRDKQDELDLAKSMRPRKRKASVPAPTPAAE